MTSSVPAVWRHDLTPEEILWSKDITFRLLQIRSKPPRGLRLFDRDGGWGPLRSRRNGNSTKGRFLCPLQPSRHESQLAGMGPVGVLGLVAEGRCTEKDVSQKHHGAFQYFTQAYIMTAGGPEQIQKAVNQYIADKTSYHVFTNNCADFVNDTLNAAEDVSVWDKTEPKDYFQGLIDTYPDCLIQ